MIRGRCVQSGNEYRPDPSELRLQFAGGEQDGNDWDAVRLYEFAGDIQGDEWSTGAGRIVTNDDDTVAEVRRGCIGDCP